MTLITTISNLSKYIPSIVQIEDFSLFEAELESAEMTLQLDFLGDVYNQIPNDDTLTKLCEVLVANMAAIKFIPQLDLLLTNSGFVITSNNNQAPASKERVERLIATCRHKVTDSITNLFSYLEKKDDYYTAWKEAKFCTRFDDLPCPTNTCFTECAVGWDNRTSLDFRNLHARMIEVRQRFLIPKIGQAFYDYILANPNEEKIRPIINDFRMAYASEVLYKHKSAHNIFSAVWEYIIENREEYPEFSSFYTAPERWENEDDTKLLAFGL